MNNWIKIYAGIFAITCGLMTFVTIYYLLGFITEPLKVWISQKLIEGRK